MHCDYYSNIIKEDGKIFQFGLVGFGLVDDDGKEGDGPDNVDHREEVQGDLVLNLVGYLRESSIIIRIK